MNGDGVLLSPTDYIKKICRMVSAGVPHCLYRGIYIFVLKIAHSLAFYRDLLTLRIVSYGYWPGTHSIMPVGQENNVRVSQATPMSPGALKPQE